MEPIVEFVASDDRGIITKETWRATTLGCPRCGNKGTNVWALVSERPIVVMGTESRIFLCILCNFTGVGLNGFRANFDASRRSIQIMELGFNDSAAEENESI
jgi:hypothetical protein